MPSFSFDTPLDFLYVVIQIDTHSICSSIRWSKPVLNPFDVKVRSFQMCAYPYLQKERRSGEERRKSRVPVGITFEFFDRRQNTNPYYSGPERRKGEDRRGLIWDRRRSKIPCYV